MSKPGEYGGSEDLIRSAIIEILDATSSLNMHPDPIPESEQLPDNNGYLSEVDRWAEHAVEHLRTAIQCLRMHGNRESPALSKMAYLLSSGQITEKELFGLACDIEEGNTTSAEQRRLHLQYLKFCHQMEVEGEGE